MTSEELARSKVNDAVAGIKQRLMEQAMLLPVDEASNAKRIELVMKFQIADDVGKTIASEVFKR